MSDRICPHCLQPISLAVIVEDIVKRHSAVGDIKLLVRGKVEATDKEIYNALGYLTRWGRVRRLGYGKYGIR